MENTRPLSGDKWRTRIAPTPSGFLHLGNLYSFSITAALAQVLGANTLLRIDDLDSERTRELYVNDIFDTLLFADIPWQQGPKNIREFTSDFSQLHRRHLYNEALQRLSDAGEIYACTCSRSALATLGTAGSSCTCRFRKIPLETKGACWRIVTENVSVVLQTPAGPLQTKLPKEMNDFIVRKKDGMPAYQLSSVVDDVFFKINLVVRGQDLFPSTIAQVFLSRLLGYQDFARTVFYHHPLINSDSGEKLSKSAGDTSIHYLKQKGLKREQVYRLMGEQVGFPGLVHWRDLCEHTDRLFH